jgi:deoxyribonuclease V
VEPIILHPWRVSLREAISIQQTLRERLKIQPLSQPARRVAGADVAYCRPTHRMCAAVVIVSLPDLTVIDSAEAVWRASFPYIPGLFTFREVPPLLEAFSRLHTEPDVLIFDGHGLAHPRRFGLACHAGVLLDRPSVGCAKSLLVGAHSRVGPERGASARLIDGKEEIGVALRTRCSVKPVYVSLGHCTDLRSAIDVVLATTRGFRVPEPIRLAHRSATTLCRRLDRQRRQRGDQSDSSRE